MNSMIKFISLVIVLSFATVASAQDRIVPPAGATPVCLQLFNELYADGNISMDDAARLTGWCIDSDRTMLGFFEHLYDTLNGSGGRPQFANMTEARAAFTSCRITAICPPQPNLTPRPRRERRDELVVEGRGPFHYEGSGWGREVVCENGTIGVPIDWRHSRTEGEDRRHAVPGITLVIIHCIDPNNAAVGPIVRRGDGGDLASAGDNYTSVFNFCSPTLPEGAVRSAGEISFCNDFHNAVTDLEGFRGTLNDFNGKLIALTLRLNQLTGRVDDLEDDAAADCGLTREEWVALSVQERRALHESGACSQAAAVAVASNGLQLQFLLGGGVHLVGFTAPASIVAPHAIVSSELVALLPGRHVGFYLRGFIGAGSLGDEVGEFNDQGTISGEGIFGGSAGLTYRFSDLFALDFGLASSAGFNPGDKVGSTIHSWPWTQVGGELRARISPTSWFYIDATVGVSSTHAETHQANATTFTGVNSVGWSGELTLGFRF